MDMNDQQLLRYSRQIMLDGFDVEGQAKLLAASVLVVGLGGLGCPAAMYLASSGVGRLVLADDDLVELSNLQRQIAHGTDDIGTGKAASARAAVLGLNPDIDVELVVERLQGKLLQAQVRAADVVIDATDNFATRFALNRACFSSGVPLVSAAAIRSEAQLSVFDPRRADSPCYSCLYSEDGEEEASCANSGVIAPLTGIIGAAQALEAIKLLSGYGEVLVGRLLVLDARYMEWRELSLTPKAGCPVCSNRA